MKYIFKTSIIFSIATFFFLLYSCSEKPEHQNEGSSSSIAAPCPDTINVDSLVRAVRMQVREEERRSLFIKADPEDNPYVNGGVYKSSHTFSLKTRVYKEPDTMSQIIAELPFNSRVSQIPEMQSLKYQRRSWIKIRHPKDVKSYGYIVDSDLADYVETSTGSNTTGFLVSEVDTIINKYPERIVEIRRFRDNEHEILESYKTKYKASGYRFRKIYNSTLKKGIYGYDYGSLFVYHTFRQSCPGGGMYEFIIDDGVKLTTVTSISYEGEGGYYDEETAYIPMKFNNGKVLLVANADVTNIFNWETADLNIFPYSSSYKVPIENLVVVKYESNGYEEVDFNVDPDDAKVETKFILYEWDGKKLNKIREGL